ncbi:hypothetical protein [Vibrio parahaemolyticus]|uniref:hypothetical protein n=1 Tax=Vibrio parahaemolyticus TaxID=670 RepID=UPI00084BACA4|nr:hypothetical protein [Vibrio parahaemolyticus]ODY89598.1 hypothetical protein BBM31_00040 [Vibrio parahaemolyticus]
MDIEYLYQVSISGEATIKDFEGCAKLLGVDVRDVFNQVSLLFAKRYAHGYESYENSDDAMNLIWPLMLDYIVSHDEELVEPTYSIYCAFDEGEYIHKDGLDPVKAYTDPAIREILENA